MDPIDLRICWNQLTSIGNESARALQRIAFSAVVREMGDLGVAICDRRGRIVVNARTAAPGHMNTISRGVQAFIEQFPLETQRPGDVFITNDPWLGNGHLFDVTVAAPVFVDGELVAFVGSNVHHTDMGGTGFGVTARDVHEEGLWIPPLKLVSAGEPNETLYALIARNVRQPSEVRGDLAAQISCAAVASARLEEFSHAHSQYTLQAIADAIIDRSEEATRSAIRALPGGRYRGATSFDIGDDQLIRLQVEVRIDSEAGDLVADFTGSSPMSDAGINVVAPYAHAYTRFALRCLLNPTMPNNHGSLEPFRFFAPEGCILNATYPRPVAARHTVAMNIPMAINDALQQLFPSRVVAEAIAGGFGASISGLKADGAPYSAMITASGGMGARKDKPGLAATNYPVGLGNTPVEVIEAGAPIEFQRKSLRRGSGGPGLQPGGDGVVVEFEVYSPEPSTLSPYVGRVLKPPKGLAGGGAGDKGVFSVNGEVLTNGRRMRLQAGDLVRFESPGGGGFGEVA